MNLKNAMVCWTPGTDKVGLVAWPDSCGTSNGYDFTWGACCSEVQKASFEKRKAMAFIEAVHLIVGDKCPADAVHRALLGLEEYVAGLSDDMPRHP